LAAPGARYWQVLVPELHIAVAAQSAGPAQGAAVQALAPAHVYGAQLVVAPGVQVPWPSQVEAAVSIDVEGSHEPARQTAPIAWSAHMPLPSHVPVEPHVEALIGRQVARGSLPPAGTGWQLPAFCATAHEVHGSQLAESQHTFSTQ
jgi:hypothetical protein